MNFKTDRVKPSNATSTKMVVAWKGDTLKRQRILIPPYGGSNPPAPATPTFAFVRKRSSVIARR
jgi:hypothetical protein